MATKKAAPATAPAKPAPAARTKKAATPRSQGAMRTERAVAAAAAPKSPEAPTKGIKVVATQTGYHGMKRRREGDVFFINDESEFSHRWMRLAERGARLRETGAQESLDQVHDEILGGKLPKPGASLDDDDDIK